MSVDWLCFSLSSPEKLTPSLYEAGGCDLSLVNFEPATRRASNNVWLVSNSQFAFVQMKKPTNPLGVFRIVLNLEQFHVIFVERFQLLDC